MPVTYRQTPTRELNIELSGAWTLGDGLAPKPELDSAPIALVYDTAGVTSWDSSLIEFLFRAESWAATNEVPTNRAQLPAAMAGLLSLALESPNRGREQLVGRRKLTFRLGSGAILRWRTLVDLVTFLGEVVLAFGRWALGIAHVRFSDVAEAFDNTGPKALPIVALVSILIGLIMGFIGAVQLRRFGAEVYVANLVAIAMTREMGALMTAVILSGRTAAAHAANLGTMKGNDEISALTTTGLDPVEFLVVPRVLALMIAMPLLTAFSDLIGILGGMGLGTLMLHLDVYLYISQTIRSLAMADFLLGLVKSVFFGGILGIVGCWCGMRAERHAQGVGDAATQAVVLCIVLILSTDAIFTLVTTILNI